MIKAFELRIAKRYIGYKNKFASLLSYFATIGIMLGVMTLVIVMSVMNGYEVELIKKILGINGHIGVSNYERKIANHEEMLIKIFRSSENVKFAAPIVLGEALAQAKDRSSGVLIRGMKISDLNKKPIMKNSMISEDNVSFEKNEVIIGVSLARTLGVEIGDKLRLLIPIFEDTFIGSIPRIKTLKVVGIFDVGMYEYNASTIFVPLKTAQLLFKTGDFVSEIEVILDNQKNISKAKESIIKSLAADGVLITDWGLANKSLMAALKVERNTMFIILILIVMIAAFNIVSGLTMMVNENHKNIAILRAIGMNKSSVIKIFVLAGTYLGFIGSVAGVVFGIAFVTNINHIKAALESFTGSTLFDPMIYFLTSLPSEPDFKEIIAIFIISMILSFISTIYPAWKASRMLPADALRYE
jgi:lipoprotein-releasing system permease protein